MSRTSTIALKSVIRSASSGFASGEKADDGIAQVRMNNVETDGTWNWSNIRRIPRDKVKESYYLRDGDVLFNATNSPNLVGKSAYFRGFDEPIVFSNHFVRLRPELEKLDGRYLARWLNVLWRSRIFETGCTQWVNQATYRKDDLLSLEIPLPTLAEQKRIAAILDAADALRTKRRDSLAQLDTLLQSTFLDMFGDPVTNPKRWEESKVDEIGSVQGGLQVTSKRKSLPIERPYLRVANVFRGFLDLSEIKTIRLTKAEETRVRLKADDILIVEGHGNKEEIGRCARWDGSIENCVHQNHLIRLRCNRSKAVPVFVETYLNSEGGRKGLLGTSRTTSGLNTISVSKVKNTVIHLPSLDLQHRFAAIVESAEQQKARLREHLAELDTLFASLQQRAFNGDL